MPFERQALAQGAQIVLGHTSYRIDSMLGCGSSAIVYEASYPDQMNPDYVHKVLIREFFPYDKKGLIYRDERGYICFDESRREIMDKQKIYFARGNQINLELMKNHPHNVSYNMNTYEAYGSYYTIMAMHGGQVLENILHDESREKLTLSQMIRILQKILTALQPFHELRLLHIDISPDNILIFDDCAMLIDYNSAFYLDEPVEDFEFYVKEGYAAPEILLGNYEKINFCTDLFSVCALFFRMLTSRRLTDKEYRSRNLLQTVLDETNLSETESEDVLRLLSFILMKGLHTLPQKRYQTIPEMMADLDKLLDQVEGKGQEKNLPEENDATGVKRKKKMKQAALLITILLIAACATAFLAKTKPWVVKAEAFGNSNSNIYNLGKYLLIYNQYEYFVDLEGNLRLCKYDDEKKMFPVNKSEIIYQVEGDDYVKFLNRAEDKIYFVHTDSASGADQIMCMDLDGKKLEVLSTLEKGEEGDFYNYAKLSDGKEYMYYLLGETAEDGSFEATDICRLNIADQKTEKIISGDLQWFNLTEDAVYYIDYYEVEQEGQDKNAEDYEPEYNTVLHKTDLKGRHDQVIDDSSHFAVGFIEGDVAYLLSLDYVHEGLIAYNLKTDVGNKEAQESFNYTGIFDVDVYNVEFAYDNGWIYYSPFDSPELHKIRADGTNDKMVYEGISAEEINFQDDYIMLSGSTGENLEEETIRLIGKDGNDCVEVE